MTILLGMTENYQKMSEIDRVCTKWALNNITTDIALKKIREIVKE